MKDCHAKVLADLLDDAEERLANLHQLSRHQAELAQRARLAWGTIQSIKSHVMHGEKWTAEDELEDDARRARIWEAPF